MIRIATRESPLALWQADYVKARLLAAHPGLQVELVPMTTKGLSAVAPAWFVYTPGVADTVTPKVRLVEPDAGTGIGPAHVRD